MKSTYDFIRDKLSEREAIGTLRVLKPGSELIDFCSNDYLGFARSQSLRLAIEREILKQPVVTNGATGSRLLTGNTEYAEHLEKEIATIHNAEAGLIFNSGYDANVGLFSSLPQRGDTIITDELIHASIIDGARLSHANRYIFKHNDLDSLESKLKQAKGNCYVAIESVYSMDGDMAPIAGILTLTEKYNANLIVDEAHAIGVFNYGLVTNAQSNLVFARVVTFGKALGCHGAIVLGSNDLKNYLVNFARSFIYSTAPPLNFFAAIKSAYHYLAQAGDEIAILHANIKSFNENINAVNNTRYLKSKSAIHCLVLSSNEKAKRVALTLQQTGFDVRAILSPTVPLGTERVRICIHAYNTMQEIINLSECIKTIIDE